MEGNMADNETCDWTGKSGNTYTYYIYKLPVSFNENQDGNYIFAKVVNKLWRPIYIGQGNLEVRISDEHHKIEAKVYWKVGKLLMDDIAKLNLMVNLKYQMGNEIKIHQNRKF